jgi:hypothetical protein
MKKQDLIKAVLAEAVKRHLEEMPRMKDYYTLTSDWEEKANSISGRLGPKSRDIILKLESLEDQDHFDRDDIMKLFKFARPQGANGFIKLLLDSGVIMNIKGQISKKDIETDLDDEWTVAALPGSDIGQVEDNLAKLIRKIGIDPNVRRINFIIYKKYKMTIPRELQRQLAVEYGSVRDGMYNKYGVRIYDPANTVFTTITQFKTTPYKFFKPFVEDRLFKNIPSDSPITLKKYNWTDKRPQITDLFPKVEDFLSFVNKYPNNFKVESYGRGISPQQIEQMKRDGIILTLSETTTTIET